jgi:hypothetical protein
MGLIAFSRNSQEEKKVKWVICVALALAAMPSCGPIDYLHTVSLKARRAVANATAADAQRLSPYEYWSAVEYLQMAREKAAYADYEIAISYGDKALTMANDALRLSSEREQAPSVNRPKHSAEEETPPDLSSKNPTSGSGGGSKP